MAKSQSITHLQYPSGRADFDWKTLIWQGIAPYKVEAFAWRVLLRRVPVRSELVKRGVMTVSESCCPLCNECEESVTHLFFSCGIVWKVWGGFLEVWEVSSVLPNDPKDFFMAWKELLPAVYKCRIVWGIIPQAVIWSVWLHRNDLVFNGKKPDVRQIKFAAKVRVVCWLEAKFKGAPFTKEDFLADLSRATDTILKKMGLVLCSWSPPPVGTFKFNVDGAFKADESVGGIGGILRNDAGKLLFSFSNLIGSVSPLLAEALAIEHTLELTTASTWLNNFKVVIESDCEVMVKVDLTCVPRGCNALVDWFAKKALG
ncbi:hypothetical protein F3Y22_tig00110264pilonHSYRG00352 [Hibiscus syriacus]|uniref:Reverse transcriptase zinc-binding domain-containing protein n=1 Tax=Hibiscus syriacus TaxID=106335 RepID=A0A6A3B6U3_HIBSY|nr:hypothetical protein F3Y22_tig00110264pilonHSYRG00352 [Hibiscus syriacus]